LYLSNQIGLLGEEIRIADWLPRLAAHLTQPQEGHPDVFLLDKAPLIASPQFPHLNILIVRRSLALEIGGFWEQTRYEEDVNFFWRTLDRANVILFRQAITARHAIPLKDQRANVTTSLSEMDKLTLRGLSCRHAATQVTTPALARRILAQEADVLRHLTLILRDQGQIPAARTYARMALAGRFSLKWLLFCLWLSWR